MKIFLSIIWVAVTGALAAYVDILGGHASVIWLIGAITGQVQMLILNNLD
jgi:hypothetical protein